jgi:hypothetical protein
MAKVNHENGEPYLCSEECSRTNSHFGDAPDGFVCANCGGGAGCYPKCRERELYRPFEEYEGLTGAQEYYDWEY